MKSATSFTRMLAAVAVIAAMQLWMASCENDEKEIRLLTQKVDSREEGVDIQSVLSQDGKLRAKLQAPIMYRYSADTQMVEFPKTLHCDFFNDSLVKETWLDCKYGKYYEQLNKVYLRDSVVVINIKGDTLRTPDLWWDQNTKLFYTDQYAEYHGANKMINGGKGMVATQDLSSITFKYPTGIIKGTENGDFTK